jgi:hypothetical protein
MRRRGKTLERATVNRAAPFKKVLALRCLGVDMCSNEHLRNNIFEEFDTSESVKGKWKSRSKRE